MEAQKELDNLDVLPGEFGWLTPSVDGRILTAQVRGWVRKREEMMWLALGLGLGLGLSGPWTRATGLDLNTVVLNRDMNLPARSPQEEAFVAAWRDRAWRKDANRGLWCLTTYPAANTSFTRCPKENMCCFTQNITYYTEGRAGAVYSSLEGGCGSCSRGLVGPRKGMPMGRALLCTAYHINIIPTIARSHGDKTAAGRSCVCSGSMCNNPVLADDLFVPPIRYALLSDGAENKVALEPAAVGRCYFMPKQRLAGDLHPSMSKQCPEKCCSWRLNVWRDDILLSADCGWDCDGQNKLPDEDAAGGKPKLRKPSKSQRKKALKGSKYWCVMEKPKSGAENRYDTRHPILCFCEGAFCNFDRPSYYNLIVEEAIETYMEALRFPPPPPPLYSDDFFCADSGVRLDPLDVDGAAGRIDPATTLRFYVPCRECCWAYKMTVADFNYHVPAGCHRCSPDRQLTPTDREQARDRIWYAQMSAKERRDQSDDPDYVGYGPNLECFYGGHKRHQLFLQKAREDFPWNPDLGPTRPREFIACMCRGADYCNEEPAGQLSKGEDPLEKWELVTEHNDWTGLNASSPYIMRTRAKPREKDPQVFLPPLPYPYNLWPLTMMEDHSKANVAHSAATAPLLILAATTAALLMSC